MAFLLELEWRIKCLPFNYIDATELYLLPFSFMLGFNYSACLWLTSVCSSVLTSCPKCALKVVMKVGSPCWPLLTSCWFLNTWLINIIWYFCLEKHLFALHSVFTHFWLLSLLFCSVLLHSLPYHNVLWCKESDALGRGLTSTDSGPHQHQLWYRSQDVSGKHTVLSYRYSKKGN